jgi:5-methyltetrahydrofolate--homocysteine methyltransferase
MPACVAELDRRKLPFPVMVGGAAINRAYGQRILYVGEPGQEQPYGPGVFYARDAFEGLEIVEALTDSEKHTPVVERVKREAQSARELQAEREAARAAAPAVASEHPPVAPAPVIIAPFWGPRVLDRVAVEDVATYLDKNALYRGRWGGVAHGDEYKRLVREEFEPRLERLLREARQRQYLHPRAVYGYYPARAEGDTLVVLDPSDQARVLERFTFPRQPDGQRLCLADYFATESGEPTAVAFQVVTMGDRASQETERMQAAGDYSEAYFLHGLSVQMAEAMADYVNARVREELKLTGEAGRRYSWGYAAIPELADHERVFRLMGVPEAIGVTLTDSYQLVPEQSTAAIVVPHPGSVYFAVREAAASNAG